MWQFYLSAQELVGKRGLAGVGRSDDGDSQHFGLWGLVRAALHHAGLLLCGGRRAHTVPSPRGGAGGRRAALTSAGGHGRRVPAQGRAWPLAGEAQDVAQRRTAPAAAGAALQENR